MAQTTDPIVVPLATPVFFGGRRTSKILRVDPAGLTLPAMTEGVIYGYTPTEDYDVWPADPEFSTCIYGVYVGTDAGGFLQFEQSCYVDEENSPFGLRGTRWHLDTGGTLTDTGTTVLFGVAVDASTLMITVGSGSASPPLN